MFVIDVTVHASIADELGGFQLSLFVLTLLMECLSPDFSRKWIGTLGFYGLC